MRRTVFCLCLVCLTPVWADQQVLSGQFERGLSGGRLRIQLVNPTAQSSPPLQVGIWARPFRFCPWIPLRSWTSVAGLAPRRRLVRELFTEGNWALQLLATGPFQVQARVQSTTQERWAGFAEFQVPDAPR